MKFRAHETFFIRKGWLYKGLKNVTVNKYVFMGIDEKPMDILGIGNNMVKALRYWMQATGLTVEPSSGKRYQTLTKFGKIVYENDKYMEELGTLWLIHYKLASNFKEATAWYYFFNEFNVNEFTSEDFTQRLDNYIINYNKNSDNKSDRILSDEFNCILGTYLPRYKLSKTKIDPENNIECPLGDLDLIDICDNNKRIYKKKSPKIDTLDPLICLAIIVDNLDNKTEINITSLLNENCNIGKILNLDIMGLNAILNKLENLNYLKVIRTAGLDVVRLSEKIKGDNNTEKFLYCVNEYYSNINA